MESQLYDRQKKTQIGLNVRFFFVVFQAPPATDPVVQWPVQWPNDITMLNRAGVQWLCRATPEEGYAKIAQESNLVPRKRSPPNGAPEQSGLLELL